MRSRTSGVAGHVVPGDVGDAAVRAQQRAQHPHERRLPGPVGAQEPVDLPPCDVEVDPVHGAHRAEAPHQAPGQHRAARHVGFVDATVPVASLDTEPNPTYS